ncbi:hemerythrin domain-containing protein [Actinoplanes sp. TBRC 11911]|uniref:hemerythrin domain-containing protein n=1 Tax=Actinoplanes sp. TBRC 11911 TaxID=2729386 RepID=UPI00145CD00C|nr:hemerythrin domain-containing protein [Actinoplanes sp. TBRC 11911]NMO55528.1 hemerythrin domain-containing protein [Actinoplanes sp. TBRC 11911]
MTNEMVMVHTGLRREFGFMPDLARGVFEGGRHRAGVVAGHIELMLSLLQNHLDGEDVALWPRLLERCPAEILPLVHAMEDHHARIATLAGELTKHTTAWRTDASVSHREAVLHTLSALLPILWEHLGLEERYVLPLIEKHITPTEWSGMLADAATRFPPSTLPLIYGVLLYEGAPSAVEAYFAGIPPEIRAAITEKAPHEYGDYAKRVYGTRTPPRSAPTSPVRAPHPRRSPSHSTQPPAQSAQSAAQSAQPPAQSAQSAAHSAQSAAHSAQSAAQSA